MRFALRIAVLALVFLMLLAPIAGYASDGPCPDDPELAKNCASQTPPFYVVSNRSFERLGSQYGTGCQPWILENPDCKACADESDACHAAAIDVEQLICGGEMPAVGAQAGDILFEMCCNCPDDNPDGAWMYRERVLQERDGAWECPDPGPWVEGLPPETGIDLPAPIIVGGLALIGLALLAAGVMVHLRTPGLA